MKVPIAIAVVVSLCSGLLSCEKKSAEGGADMTVTVYQIDGAIENMGQWEHRIEDQMVVPKSDAITIAKALSIAGKPPPSLLDTLHIRCGVQVGGRSFVVTSFFERGVEVQPATMADGKIRLTGESRVLGKLPEIAKILESCVFKMLDNGKIKRKEEAEHADASDGDNTPN